MIMTIIIFRWNFSAFLLDRFSGGHSLSTLCLHLFHQLGEGGDDYGDGGGDDDVDGDDGDDGDGDDHSLSSSSVISLSSTPPLSSQSLSSLLS